MPSINTSSFFGSSPTATSYEGRTEGTITWYNRSVGVQGWVLDTAKTNRSTTVIFRFYIGSPHDDLFWHSESRTVNDGTRSFNFTAEGPVGGITWVSISLCHAVDEPCLLVQTHTRAGAS